MNKLKDDSNRIPISAGYLLIALGVVYGDIGTSPLYVMKSVVSGNGGFTSLNDDFIIGALSLIIWTVTLITTVKYVIIAMKADNHGEGGIFSLYHLVMRSGKYYVIPAMLGGAALLADGILTPAVTVTSAIEGLRDVPVFKDVLGDNRYIIIAIAVAIISAIFILQRAGTNLIGKAFGPIMFVWFSFIAIMGIIMIRLDPRIFLAFDPIRGIKLLLSPYNKAGLMILGSVFLSTTGAEALYSDMGHVGKANIYGSWPYVKVCLILNYLGQGAWLMHIRQDPALYSEYEKNPFFDMLPENIRLFAVILSTVAAIIASQALITGAYTLVKEAIHLRLLPHLQIRYPAEKKGQIYIPMVNNLLWICCIGVIFYFQSSDRMEAAYGLAITVTMLMTTVLIFRYLCIKKVNPVLITAFIIFFGILESIFFVSNATKFINGGFVAVIIALFIFMIMLIWYQGHRIEEKHDILYPTAKFISRLTKLRDDTSIPYSAANLVYMTINGDLMLLEKDILYSILAKRPKRAQVYWFIHINVVDDPNTMAYSVQNFGTDFCFKVKLKLGFKVEQRINVFMRQIIHDLIESGEIKPQMQVYSMYDDSDIGDFKFVFIKKTLAPGSNLSGPERFIIRMKYTINNFTGSPVRWFGLENANTIIESVPLLLKPDDSVSLTRED